MVADRPLRVVAVCGWWFGFGFAVSGLYWISISFVVRGGDFVWMVAPAMLILWSVIACFPALAMTASIGFCRFAGLRGVARIFIFALCWTFGEWLQGRWISDFPWNPLGTSGAFSDAMIQPAAWGGVWFLSFLAVVIAAMPAAWPLSAYRQKPRRLWHPCVIAGCLAMLIFTVGQARLHADLPGPAPGLFLHLVQANIAQKDKHNHDLREDHFQRQWRMSMESLRDYPTRPGLATALIWPEDAFFYPIQFDRQKRSALAALLPEKSVALVGALRFSFVDDRLDRIWNSLYALDPNGSITAFYDKHRLVPFGEYIPLRGLFDLDKITPGQRDFSAGPANRVIDLFTIPPFSPLICYEAIFSSRVLPSGERAQWLLNVTNDGWFGDSSGPWQHLTLARLRATEEGIPLIRVANTGVSAVVDSYGRIVASLGLDRQGVLRADLPGAIASTPYGRYGDGGFFALLLAAGVVVSIVFGRRFRRRSIFHR